jgi:nucleoside-diphosphate-sugar epimerase/aryl carrier-like protein
MLPNGYEVVPALPVTIGGKVDRQNLLTRKLQLIFPSINVKSASETEPAQRGLSADPLKEVIGIFRDVLSLGEERQIKGTESFFELGGQSILVLRLQAKIKKAKKVTLSLPVLFKNPTPEAITSLISKKLASTSPKANAENLMVDAKEEVDWESDTTLPISRKYVVPYGTQQRSRSDQTSPLVTGAETFIGLYMVSTLLHSRSDTVIHFLGCEEQISLHQLETALRKYLLLDSSWTPERLASRLHPVPGSLSESHLGLPELDFVTLGREIHAIYHLGGEISLLKTYADLKLVNIDATLDIIELASLGTSAAEIHYLSTWSVLHLQSWSSTTFKPSQYSSLPVAVSRTIRIEEETAESFIPAPPSEKGYFKARWVAEILLTRASQRGFPVTIYRPSAVTASTQTKIPEPAGDMIR